ncbi:MAG: hypothetical protein H0T79_18125 [Deltaproteobacteria bacterium]|nr:hypothetical protein [Deltaproteobacteria bacterium]
MATGACGRLRGGFLPIGGSRPSEPITGTLWVEKCAATKRGTQLALEVAGRGWTWVSREEEAAGAAFELNQYVRFGFSMRVHGAIDAAYEPHVFTLWFTPDGAPDVAFQPIGGVNVESEGLWSDVVGGIASAFAQSPEQRAGTKVKLTGRQMLEAQLSKGIAVTANLCTGNVQTGFGHPEAGKMLEPGATRSEDLAVVHSTGFLLRGPLTVVPTKIAMRMVRGGIASTLVCQKDAIALADAFLEQRSFPAVRAVKGVQFRTTGTLRVPSGGCPLVQVIRPIEAAKEPAHVKVSATGLAARIPPLVRCD